MSSYERKRHQFTECPLSGVTNGRLYVWNEGGCCQSASFTSSQGAINDPAQTKPDIWI